MWERLEGGEFKKMWERGRVRGLFFFLLGFTPCKAEQPLRGMELQEKKHKKDYRIQVEVDKVGG